MKSWDEFQQVAAAYGIAAAVAIVVIAVGRFGTTGRFLPSPRLRPGRWSGLMVVVQFVAMFVCFTLGTTLLANVGYFDRTLPPGASEERRQSLAAPFSTVFYLAIGFTLLFAAQRTSIAKVGLSSLRWRQNAMLGAIGFLLTTPVVLGIFTLCLLAFPMGEHPIARLANEPLAWYEWAALFVQTVVLSPIIEEWLFRGLLQGWLRRTNLTGHVTLVWIVIALVALASYAQYASNVETRKPEIERREDDAPKLPAEASSTAELLAPIAFILLVAGAYGAGVVILYRPIFKGGLGYFFATESPPFMKAAPDFWTSNLFEAEGRELRTMPWSEFGPGWTRWKDRNARLAIFGSAMAFAIAHSSWPSAVPLLVLGLVLGWLAYRTQSLVPSITLHSLFNLVAFIALWLKVHPGIIGSSDSTTRRSPDSVGTVNVVPAVCVPR